jgi:hypothetical protein
VAVSVAALLASTMKFCTSLLLLASAVTTWLELVVSAFSVAESLASRLSRLSVSVSAGTARCSAACRSPERPATAAPSSLMINVRRWRYGSRMMLLIRSNGIVDTVWVTGIVQTTLLQSGLLLPGVSSWPVDPGSQST